MKTQASSSSVSIKGETKIKSLVLEKNDDSLERDPTSVKAIFIHHFKGLFNINIRSNFEGMTNAITKRILANIVEEMIREMTREGINKTIFDMANYKALSLDGYGYSS